MKESPCILVNLPFCYLPYDHGVRKQIKKIAFAEKQRRLCKASYNSATAARREDEDTPDA